MSSSSRLVVAIDGPAGAGKSTIAGLLANALGLRLLDTGAMYRALAIKALRLGISTEDAEASTELARSTKIRFSQNSPAQIQLDGEDVSLEIRTLKAGQAASEISVHPGVRRALVALQQSVIAEGGYVLEGRDTTTVVAPNADLKVFLTASIETRARRRWLELKAKGEAPRIQDIVIDVVRRDHRDYTREDSPLQLAEDVAIIETGSIGPEAVLKAVLDLLPDRPAGMQ